MSLPNGGLLLGKPPEASCEAKQPLGGRCGQRATHIYGPECEATTGKLMYLCSSHALFIEDWRAQHANDPVECPTHGNIGKVKDYLILKAM